MKNLKLELLHFVLPVLLFAAFIDPAVSQIIDPDKYYYIVNGQSSRKLGIMDSSSSKGAACVLTKSNGANTQFKFEPAGGDYYYIRAKHTNYALCIAGRNPANGVRLVQWSKQEAPHFMFRIEPAGGSGSYNIIAKHSNKALYIEGASNEEGTNCVQWDHETYDYHQMFRFSAVSSTSTRDPYNLGRPVLESPQNKFSIENKSAWEVRFRVKAGGEGWSEWKQISKGQTDSHEAFDAFDDCEVEWLNLIHWESLRGVPSPRSSSKIVVTGDLFSGIKATSD